MSTNERWAPSALRPEVVASPPEQREVVAIALARRRGARPWRYLTPAQRDFYLADADAAIAAMGDLGPDDLRAAVADAVARIREILGSLPVPELPATDSPERGSAAPRPVVEAS
jgi:hypothetical protein